jgi:hypothetical protein
MTLEHLRRGFLVVAYCGCGHRAELDLARLAKAKGWDLETTAIRRCLRCSVCGTREVEIRIVYDGGIRFRHDGMVRPAPPACASAS